MKEQLEKPNSVKNMMRKIGLVFFLVLFVGLLLYRIFLPWTPFWMDFIIIFIGAVIFIFTHKPPSADKKTNFEG